MAGIEERPPYVEFVYKPMEDRAASIRQGHYVARDVAFAKVWRAGSKDMLEKNAEDWLLGLKQAGEAGMIPTAWHEHFKKKFEAWKLGEETPTEGTPIKGWPVLSPAAQAMVIKAGYLTVEDLANSSDNEVGGIGMGAVGFKNKARAWLDAAEGPGKMTEKFETLRAELAEQKLQNQRLSTIVAELKGKLEEKV